MYRIHELKLHVGEPLERLPEKILKKIGRKDILIRDWQIVKESIDARDKSSIWLVYSVDFEAVSAKNPKKKISLAANPKLKLEIAPDMTYKQAVSAEGAAVLKHRPVIVGFGPAGMFAGLILAQAGYRPLVLERGQDVDSRTAAVEKFWETGELDTESNVQFGEGGAGTFSDGKLTTGIKDVRIRKVLEELVRAGSPEDILYKQKPHVGTDVLRGVVKSVREEIKALGGDVMFGARVSDFVESEGKLSAVELADGRRIDCEAAVFAIGHSSRDTFRWLHKKGVKMAQKPFSIGLRIEHPQDVIDTAQYGAPARELGLPVADYKLNWRCENGRGVYTFCMCPGGRVVIASSQEGGVVTNGMSYHGRDTGIANSALLCDVRTEDFGSDEVLAGVEFQEKYERLAYINGGSSYKAPSSTWGQLRDGQAPQVENSLPEFAVAAMREAMPHLGRKLRGFDADDAKVTAVEARSSSPVRFARDESYEGELCGRTLEGFYPCGEGAGYAGGIMSAAVDGIRVAEAIISKWLPPEQ
ncbi:MAG: NAD(FAD)-utilizing dehydrogenase [Firmicutes bacterium]|nr:NAD(FAD)-utilizing dehydrogenase [Bacillota bacterium]